MKKKLKLLMVFLLTFTLMTTNVLADDPSSTAKGGTATKGGGTGGGSGTGGCDIGSTNRECALAKGAGMRISVMYLSENGFVVVGSKTYLQYQYGYNPYTKYGLTYIGDNKDKVVKMAVNYANPGGFYGTRYEYLNGASVPSASNWTKYSYSKPSNKDNDNSYLKKGNTVIEQLDASWKGIVSLNQDWLDKTDNSKGYQDAGANFTGITTLKDILVSDGQKALPANQRLITQFITSNDLLDLGNGLKIKGLGITNIDFNDILCNTEQVYVMFEPMVTKRGSDADYLGTATEIAWLEERGVIKEGHHHLWHILTYNASHLHYLDQIEGVGQFNPDISWRFPMFKPYKEKRTCVSWECKSGGQKKDSNGNVKLNKYGKPKCKTNMEKAHKDANCNYFETKYEEACKNYKCLRNEGGNAYGVGVQFDWIGWGRGSCYTCYSETTPNVTNPNPVCNQKRTQVIEQKFVEDSAACENQPNIEATDKRSKEIHENGYLVGKTYPEGVGRKYCGVYCRDIATITYPVSLTDPISLNFTSYNRGNGKAVWPDLNNHKLSVEIRKKCVIDVKGEPGQDAINQCNATLASINQNTSGIGSPEAEFSLTYTDSVYGKENNKFINFKLNNTEPKANVQKSGNDLVYKTNVSLTDVNTTYSVFNRNTNRYQIKNKINGGLQNYHNNIGVAQLAISEASLNKAQNDSGTKSATNNNNMNIIVNKIGYSEHLLVNDGKTVLGDVNFTPYTCKYRVENPTSCASCKSKDGREYSVCCLAPTDAQAYDTYCENGYLKPEYDVPGINANDGKITRDEMKNACVCTNPNTGITYNMYDDTQFTNKEEQSCMSKVYQDALSGKNNNIITKQDLLNSSTSWQKAYNYCLNIFKKPGGSCSKPDTPTTETCPPDAQKHAGEEIPPGETKDSWCCNPILCPRHCTCKSKVDNQSVVYITAEKVKILKEGKVTDETEACNLAKNTSPLCVNSGGPGGPGGPGTPTTNSSENYLYHTIDLTNPFVESSLMASSSNAQNRIPGSNWTSAIANNQTTLTTKYITSKSDIYTSNKSALYTIELSPSATNKVREYNKTHDYNDFTLDCTDKVCKSTFLQGFVTPKSTMYTTTKGQLETKINNYRRENK